MYLIFTHYQKNTNEKNNDVTSHTNKQGFYQRIQTSFVGGDVVKKKTSFTVSLLMGMSSGLTFMENGVEISHKIKSKTPI